MALNMVSYQALSDAVGILDTSIVKRHWVSSSEGIPLVLREEARPIRCIVWIPNEGRDRPAEPRLILELTMAADVGKASAPGLAVAS